MPDFASALWNKPTSGDTGEGGGASDPVTRSLRFESGATHRLTKTFGSAPTSSKVSTLAFWVKRSKLGSSQHIISANGTSHSENTNSFYVEFKADDTLRVSSYPDPQTNVFTLTTSRKFRDVGAWMHIAILIDTDESAAADRCKIYINGVREPSANLSGTNPSSGATNHLLGKATTTHYGSGNVNVQHCIGDEADRFRYKYSGYLADFYFVDGTAVEPDTNFIESTGYGGYKPKAFDMSSYSGNSFHLLFEDSSDIGSDSTSNSNDFTPTNLSSHDVMLDTPTKNYATLNPLDAGGGTFSEGNLKWAAGGSHRAVRLTQAALAGDKTYFEVYYPDSWSNQPMIGLMGAEAKISDHQSANPSLWFRSNGYEYNNGSESNASNPTWTNGDIVGVAVDLSAGELKYRVNNGSFTTAFTGLSSSTTWIPAIKGYDTSPAYILNTGSDPTFAGNKTSGQDTSQSEFYYAPPTGFKSLNTSNLGTPTVTPSEHFNTVLWAGSGSQDNDISGVGFQPDFTWVKNRTSSREHALHDSVRGAGKELRSNSTLEESDKSTMFGPFQSDGFRVAESSVGGAYNDSGNNYVAWNWKESASAGFDIVTYEGDSDSSGDSQNISHSLGVAPEMIIVKARDARAYNDYYHEDNWYVWHKDLSSDSLVFLNSNNNEMDYSYGSGYAPIRSVGASTFTVSNEEDGDYYANYLNWGDPYTYYTGDNERYVAYLFSGVEGFSKFGTYEGNNNANGPFIYCGFRPRWIMTKRIDGSSSWAIVDTARDPHNDTDKTLASELSLSESSFSTSADFDILSNGFKIRHTTFYGYSNAADTHIFAAFAESPFKHANAR